MIYRFARPENSAAAFTPTEDVANWVLETDEDYARLIEFGWSGETTVGTAMRTRIARDSAVGTGARTAITIAKEHPNAPNLTTVFASSTYATTQPTIEAGSLYQKSWNANGGIVHEYLPPGRGFSIIDDMSIECRADVGTAASSYDAAFEKE